MAARAMAAMPQVGVVCQRLTRKSRPRLLKKQVQPAHARAHGRVHQPAPDHTGDDVGDRHREQEQAAEKAFAFQPLIEQDRQQEAQQQCSRRQRPPVKISVLRIST